MNEAYNISEFCRIRNGNIHTSRGLLFNSDAPSSGAFLSEAYRHFGLNYPKFHKMDNLCKLGFLTSELLLAEQKLSEKYAGSDIGLILWNAASSVDTDRNHQQSIDDRLAYYPSPSVFVYTLANIVIGEICIRHKFYGESSFFIDKEFHADALYGYVKSLLDDQFMKCCIAGWLELDGDHYDSVLYLIEKSTTVSDGIVIFEAGKLSKIYREALWNNS